MTVPGRSSSAASWNIDILIDIPAESAAMPPPPTALACERPITDAIGSDDDHHTAEHRLHLHGRE